LTITKIDLKRDISECTVFYSVLGEDSERSKCQHALNDCCGFIQSQVAGALKTRVTPRLKFEFDPSVAGSIRIAEMLRLDREKNEPTDEVDDSCVLPDDPATD
jgi:ribosome-binding factor A